LLTCTRIFTKPGPAEIRNGISSQDSRILHWIAFLTLFMLAEHSASADSVTDTLRKMCLHGLASQTQMPPDASAEFCACFTVTVDQNMTTQQRQIFSKVWKDAQAGRNRDTIKRDATEIRVIVQHAQQECSEKLWPSRSPISEQEHTDYAARANESFDDYEQFTESACKSLPETVKRDHCLVEASHEWLARTGSKYDDIPSSYITGEAAAKSFIEHAKEHQGH
jgi:hypothetical protein